MQEAYLKRGWDQAAGSSGTVRAILEAQKALDPEGHGHHAPTASRRSIGTAGRPRATSRHCAGGVTDERRAVFPGGVAILAEVFAQLGSSRCAGQRARCARACSTTWSAASPTRMRASAPCAPCSGATTSTSTQAARVEQTALLLLEQVQDSWQLRRPAGRAGAGLGGRLHEIGLDVAHSGYHRHGAYLLENADMPGFAREEQLLLARLVGAHRRKLVLGGVSDLIPPWDDARDVPDRAPAAGRAAAPRPQRRAAARRDAQWAGRDAGAALPASAGSATIR